MTDDIFDPLKDSDFANTRTAVRYSSIKSRAVITLKQLFRGKKYIKARIVDLSSKGARISTRYKLPDDTNIIFNLKTQEDAVVWKVPAKVVRAYSYSEFGIAFDTPQNGLIDEVMQNEADSLTIQ